MSYVRPLEAVTTGDLATAGGKALGCAALLRLGMPVPRGFVLVSDAFEKFLDSTGLDEKRHALLESFNRSRPQEEINSICTNMEEAVRSAAIPPAIEQDVMQASAALGCALAVRSSASMEDQQATALAGVFHSELDVDPGDVCDAISECWSQTFRSSVLIQILRNGLDPARLRVALLIQEMSPCQLAGVLFTEDPTGTRPDRAVLSFTRQSGADLMQGELSGQTCELDRDTGRILSGEVPESLARRLWRFGRKLERARDHPQDIEWTAIGETVSLLQTRPITTVEKRRGRPVTWTRELSEERFPQPISPLGWSLLKPLLASNVDTLANRFGLVARQPDEVARTIGNYVYSNQRFFAIPGSLRPNPFSQIRFLPQHLREFFGLLAGLPGAIAGKRFGPRLLLFTRLYRAFILPHAREVQSSWDAHLADLVREMDATGDVVFSNLTLDELWRHKDRIDDVTRRYMEPDLAIYVIKMATSWILEKIGQGLEDDSAPMFLANLTSGAGQNRTLEMSAELENLFDTIRDQESLLQQLEEGGDEEFLQALDGEAARAFRNFVVRNGHTTTCWDIREPTWGEEPRLIVQLLRHFASAESPTTCRSHQADRQEAARQARAAATSALQGDRWLIPFFDEALSTLDEFMRIDEEHHFYCSRLFQPLRRLFAEIGARLAEARILDTAEDVYFLTLDELQIASRENRGFPRRYLVDSRRTDLERSRSMRPPDMYLGQAPLLPESEAPDGADLRGLGASPGVAEGSVRVVESPADVAAFQAGEVLVTTSPNPAWSPLFGVASALVTATGSMLSHGLVSAREYRLPAVVGISNVVNRLANGQKVRVDGTQGFVSLINE